MKNLLKKILLLVLLGMTFISGGSKSLLIKSAHADTCSQGDDDDESHAGGSCG